MRILEIPGVFPRIHALLLGRLDADPIDLFCRRPQGIVRLPVHWLTMLQLALSATLLGLIVERARYLLFRAKLSDAGWTFVEASLRRGQLTELRAWARALPDTHVSSLLRAVLEPTSDRDEDDRDEELPELLSWLRERSAARLRVLRVGATIASSLGLMVGILSIQRGYAEPPGLLALEAGLPQKLAMSQALFSMGIGVATSAVCFYALTLFRPAAQALIAQSARAAHLLQDKPQSASFPGSATPP